MPNYKHFIEMTTSIGMLQFSQKDRPDPGSGYTLDDNARAMIAMCMNFELSPREVDLNYIQTYLDFINYCQLRNGSFLRSLMPK